MSTPTSIREETGNVPAQRTRARASLRWRARTFCAGILDLPDDDVLDHRCEAGQRRSACESIGDYRMLESATAGAPIVVTARAVTRHDFHVASFPSPAPRAAETLGNAGVPRVRTARCDARTTRNGLAAASLAAMSRAGETPSAHRCSRWAPAWTPAAITSLAATPVTLIAGRDDVSLAGAHRRSRSRRHDRADRAINLHFAGDAIAFARAAS